MAHLRATIRDEVVSLLEAATIAGIPGTALVYTEDRNAYEPQTTAGQYFVNVMVRSETVDYSQAMQNGIPMRIATLTLEMQYRSTTTNPHAALDDFDAGCEAALYGDQTLGGNAVGIEISDMEMEYELQERDAAKMTRNYLIYYYAQEGAPETAIT